VTQQQPNGTAAERGGTVAEASPGHQYC